MTTTDVFVEPRGAITSVTLSRPGRRNAVTAELMERLHDALDGVRASDASVVVLRGAGDDFSVGMDLAVHTDVSRPAPRFEQIRHLYHLAETVHTLPQVTIAAIDGGCAGAALGLALACDLRFASERAKFTTGFLAVASGTDQAVPWTLSRLVGAARARELLLLPEKFGAADALAYGLVTRVFAPDALHDEVGVLADRLAAAHPFALRVIKANLLAAETLPLDEYVELEAARHALVGQSRRDAASS